MAEKKSWFQKQVEILIENKELSPEELLDTIKVRFPQAKRISFKVRHEFHIELETRSYTALVDIAKG